MILILLLWCLNQQAYQQLILHSSSFETNNFIDSNEWQIINGLSSNIYSECGTNRIYGGISNFGKMTLISKFFILPPHSKIQVKLDFWKISNWANNETIYIYLDSHKAIEQQVGLLPTGLNICGGNDYILSIDESFSHNFENLQIIIAANIAIQGTIQGFWGIKNFRLFIQTCPAGCLICQEGDQRFDCLKWTLYTSSLTETNIELFNYEGWIVQNGQQQKTSNCQMLPMLCGPTLCGMNTIIKYDYILPPHFKLRIRFRQYFIDSWDLEHAYVIVNDQIIIDKSFQFQSSLRNYSLCGQSRFNDLSDTLDFEVSHTQELITFQLTNSLDQLFDDESFGIRDFRIYLYCQFGQFPSQQCSQFCGDNIVQETEECDDGNSIPFDGCHNCQYNCVQGCSNCIKGICLNCYEEWDYELISQQCKWIGVQSQQNQNYSCYNNGNCINQQEEQQQLYYQVCSLNCKLCYQDICLECQVGYNLLGGQCQEICGLSAISMFIYPNCQCDQNCLLCNFGMCQQCIDTYTLFDDKCLVICGDGLVTNGIEECDDKNEIPYDGCFQCIYQCSEQCSICEQGVCKDICKNGMPKIDGQCQSFCGNQIIEENEQCDDNNSIQYDGCYLCQFSCPLYCSNCDEGKCYECNQNYHYDQSSLSCYSICGDGILTSETEQCDDNNIFSGDGCSSTCQVEQDWICIYHEDCIYQKYPELQINYLFQKNQYQYVQIEFTQQLKRASDIVVDYSSFIKATILQMDETKYKIQIIPVSNASQTLSWVIYAFEIYIDQDLSEPPYLNIQLLETLFNQYDIKLKNLNSFIQIKIPNYLSQEDIQISQNLLEYSEKTVYSLGALSGIMLLCGNGLAFWVALEILQEQSYFKYLNIIYPQNLMIYFEQSGIISLRPLYQYFDYEQLPSIYKFRYFESQEKFQFYQVNANIVDNIRSVVFSIFILILLYHMSDQVQKCFTILEKTRYCDNNIFILKLFKNLKFRAFKNKYFIRRFGLNKFFVVNSWDIFFMVFLQLSVQQFHKFMINYIIAFITLFVSLLYITSFFTAKFPFQSSEQYLKQRLQLFLFFKKLFFMYSLVMFQSNYIQQFILICLVNSFYLVSWIYLKSLINIYEYYQTLILEGTLLIFILTTPIYWELDIYKLSYNTKLIFGWFHIVIFSFVIVFFLIVDSILTFQKILTLINKFLQAQNNQEMEKIEKQNSQMQNRPIKFIVCTQTQIK